MFYLYTLLFLDNLSLKMGTNSYSSIESYDRRPFFWDKVNNKIVDLNEVDNGAEEDA